MIDCFALLMYNLTTITVKGLNIQKSYHIDRLFKFFKQKQIVFNRKIILEVYENRN